MRSFRAPKRRSICPCCSGLPERILKDHSNRAKSLPKESQECKTDLDCTKSFTCRYCKSVYRTEIDLVKHEVVHVIPTVRIAKMFHRPSVTKSIETVNGKRPKFKQGRHNKSGGPGPKPAFLCPRCQSGFKTAGLLKRHWKIHDDGVVQEPLYIQGHLEFPTVVPYQHSRSISRHLDPRTWPNGDESKPYKCPECDYASAYRSKLEVHMRWKHPDLKWTGSVNEGCSPSGQDSGNNPSQRACPCWPQEKCSFCTPVFVKLTNILLTELE